MSFANLAAHHQKAATEAPAKEQARTEQQQQQAAAQKAEKDEKARVDAAKAARHAKILAEKKQLQTAQLRVAAQAVRATGAISAEQRAQATLAAMQSMNLDGGGDADGKPRAGTLRGVTAAESVHRRRLWAQFLLNPGVWFLKLLNTARTEEVNAYGALKKLMVHEASVPVVVGMEMDEEADEWARIVLEADASAARVAFYERDGVAEQRRMKHDFEDRLFVVSSETKLRSHITERALEQHLALRLEAAHVFARQRLTEDAGARFREEHADYLPRYALNVEEAAARCHGVVEQAATWAAVLREFNGAFDTFEGERAARLIVVAESDAFFDVTLEHEYARRIFMVEEEAPGRARIQRDSDTFLADARDNLARLLDVFYEEIAEARAAAEAAERARLEAEAEAQRQHELAQAQERADAEAAEAATRRDIDAVSAAELETMRDAMEAEQMTLTTQLASAADARTSLRDVAVGRLRRVEAEEGEAWAKVLELWAATQRAYAAYVDATAALADDEEGQREAFEWAEVESRAAIAKMMAAEGRKVGAAKPTVASDIGARPAKPKPQPKPVPQSTLFSSPTPAQQPSATYTAPSPGGAIPAGAHIVYVQASPERYALPELARHPIPVIAPQRPMEQPSLVRRHPDGSVDLDVQKAEEEVEALVSAATMPLGILEYELRARWVRTKQAIADALHKQLLEPLHELAAELPDGADIVTRARDAARREEYEPKPRRTQLAPLGDQQRSGPPANGDSSNARSAPAAPRRHAALAPLKAGGQLPPDPPRNPEASRREPTAEERERELQQRVLRSMRHLGPMPAGARKSGMSRSSNTSGARSTTDNASTPPPPASRPAPSVSSASVRSNSPPWRR